MSDGVIRLEPPTEADVDAITRACQDPQIAQWVPVPQPYTTDSARSFLADVVAPGWEHGNEPTWKIAPAVGDGDLLGMIGLHRIEHGTAEVGYWLAPWARHRGYMGRALALVVDHAFDPVGLDLQRLTWRAVVGNWPSRRVAWRAGFRVEGTLRAELVHRGGVRRDAWVGTLLRGDPRAPNEPWPGAEDTASAPEPQPV
jgi:RimJ/RimL family protein N-acetyltransferase